ncbi:hypothetical protein ACFYNO_22490 [Kitasatospora sp. NPDC006697]|uniref:hypothetical protein n=1 Tax=Kitasatospora sp. NPDC006697 TaxID=3364020 RepID=UPI0036C15543
MRSVLPAGPASRHDGVDTLLPSLPCTFPELTRKGAFFAYSHRWSHGRDENDDLLATPQAAHFTPVQRQLLGARLAAPGQVPGDHQWGHHPETTPLHGYLRERGLLDPDYPPLRP